MWLFVALVAIPLLEIGLFIQVGGLIGLWPTLATVVLTAILGAALLRRQGAAELTRLQNSFADGRDPRDPLAHGALILVAGVVLLTPGFFTDAIGFALLLPPVRRIIVRELGKRIVTAQAGDPRQPHRPARETVVDGDFTVDAMDPDDIDENGPRGTSGWTDPR